MPRGVTGPRPHRARPAYGPPAPTPTTTDAQYATRPRSPRPAALNLTTDTMNTQVEQYRHIAVAVDGSPAADLALHHAVAAARDHHAKLTIVRVVAPVSAAVAFGGFAPHGNRRRSGRGPRTARTRRRSSPRSALHDAPPPRHPR